METRSVQKSSENQTLATKQTLTSRSQFDNSYKGHPGVENNQPSKTIPDMSYTVQELLLNHTRGIESNVKNYEGQFFGDNTPKIFDDITESIAYRKDLLQQIEDQEEEYAFNLKIIEDAKIKSVELSVSKQDQKTD